MTEITDTSNEQLQQFDSEYPVLFLLKIRITILSNTEIRAGRFGVRIPVGAIYVLFSKTVYTGSGARPASCPMDKRVLVPGAKRP